jgi:hypothetical protein
MEEVPFAMAKTVRTVVMPRAKHLATEAMEGMGGMVATPADAGATAAEAVGAVTEGKEATGGMAGSEAAMEGTAVMPIDDESHGSMTLQNQKS